MLIVDCQATSSGAAGHLLELSWVRSGVGAPSARLIKLPAGVRVPPAVARLTGISQHLAERGVPAEVAWRELVSTASALPAPVPTVAHFARFERTWLTRLGADALPLDLVCTHELAARLLPELPRKSLRALAGYFGHAVDQLRRGAQHVEATLAVWRELVGLLSAQGVESWPALKAWLARPRAPRSTRRGWPMPRELRLSLPHLPGLYRMLRTTGDVLYVGKAASLHHRVNSYFRKQRGIHERTLEMLSQARALSFEVTGSALEAALLEPDEIKRHRPPYNVALTERERELWFCPPELTRRSAVASAACSLGPFPSAELLDQVAALGEASAESVGRGRWAPSRAVFEPALAAVRATHPELAASLGGPALLRLGTRLWQQGHRDRDEEVEGEAPAREWTPTLVTRALERLAVRAALARRRAQWLTRLAEATLIYEDEGTAGPRLVVVEDGAFTFLGSAPSPEPPLPARCGVGLAQRREAFTVARFDRLRVLTTELKRLVAAGSPVSLRLGPSARFTGAALGRVLEWL